MRGFGGMGLAKLIKSLGLASRIKTTIMRDNVRNCIMENDLISKIPNMDDDLVTKLAMALMEINYDDQDLYQKLLNKFSSTDQPTGGENRLRFLAFVSRGFPELADWDQIEAYFDYQHQQSRLINQEKGRLIYTFADLGKGSPRFWSQVEECIIHSIKAYELLPNKTSKHASVTLQGIYTNLLSIKKGMYHISEELQEQIYHFLMRVLDNEEVRISDKLNAMMMMTRRLRTTRLEALLKGYSYAKYYQPDAILQESLNQLQNVVWRSHHLMSGQARECEEEIVIGMAYIMVRTFKYIGFRKAVFKTDYHSLTFALKHGTELYADFRSSLELPADVMHPMVAFVTDLVNTYHANLRSESQDNKKPSAFLGLDNPFVSIFNQESSLCILLLMTCREVTPEAREDLLQAISIAVNPQDLVLTNPRRYSWAVYAWQQGILPWNPAEQKVLLEKLRVGDFGQTLVETDVRAGCPWKLKLFEDDARVFLFMKRLTVVSNVVRQCGSEAELRDGVIHLYTECLKDLGLELPAIKDRVKEMYGFETIEGDTREEDPETVSQETQRLQSQSPSSDILITDWKNWTRSISIVSTWLSGSFTLNNLLYLSERFTSKKDYLPVLEEVYSDILIHTLCNLDQQPVRQAFSRFVWENNEVLHHRLDLITLAAILKEELEGLKPESWLNLYKQSNRSARKHSNLGSDLIKEYSIRSLALSAGLGIAVLKNGIRNAYDPSIIPFSTSLFESNISGLQIWSAETIIKDWIERGSQGWVEPGVGLSSFGESHNQKPENLVIRSVSPLETRTREVILEDASKLSQINPNNWKAESAVDLLTILNWPRPRFQEEDQFSELQKELSEILGLKLQKLIENDYHRHLTRITIREVRKMQEEEVESQKAMSNPEAAAYGLQEYLGNVSKFHQIQDPKRYVQLKKRTNLFDFQSELNNLDTESQYHLLDQELEEYEAGFRLKSDESLPFKKSFKNMYLWGEVTSPQVSQKGDGDLYTNKVSSRKEERTQSGSSYEGKQRSSRDQNSSAFSQEGSEESSISEIDTDSATSSGNKKPEKKIGWVIGDALKKRDKPPGSSRTNFGGNQVRRAPSFEKYIIESVGQEKWDRKDQKD